MLKAVCTSCLHIFRQPDQKILVMRQHYGGLFVQPDEKSDVAICTNNLISVSLSKARVIFTQNIFQKHSQQRVSVLCRLCFLFVSFSDKLHIIIPSHIFSSRKYGEPSTPLLKAYAKERVIIRLLMPGDKPRNIGFVLHGHNWRAKPDDPFSTVIPAQGAISVGGVYNIEQKRRFSCSGRLFVPFGFAPMGC